jgi:hypothetical protein
VNRIADTSGASPSTVAAAFPSQKQRRFHAAHVPCRQLARVEARAALPALLRRFPRMRLGGEPVRRATGVLRGLAHLPVRPD